jgi:hypothetical protein
MRTRMVSIEVTSTDARNPAYRARRIARIVRAYERDVRARPLPN